MSQPNDHVPAQFRGPDPGGASGAGLRARIQAFGGFLTAMVIPNVGAFIAWGPAFSALTADQIVAAVLTFLVTLSGVVCYFAVREVEDLDPALRALLTRLSFIDVWRE